MKISPTAVQNPVDKSGKAPPSVATPPTSCAATNFDPAWEVPTPTESAVMWTLALGATALLAWAAYAFLD